MPTIVRVTGQPFYLDQFCCYSSFFQNLNVDNLSGNINRGRIQGGKLRYDIFIYSYCGPMPVRLSAMMALFRVLTAPDDSPVDFEFYYGEDLIAIHLLLDEFGVAEVIRDRYRRSFPFARYDDANRIYLTLNGSKTYTK